MPLQNQRRLAAAALSIRDFRPLHQLQAEQGIPPTGIHLRWSFPPAVGFPWYGYYLFRRLHRDSMPGTSIRDEVHEASLHVSAGQKKLSLPHGYIASDHPLIWCDQFEPTGKRELDLRQRTLLFALKQGSTAWKARISIGFLATATEADAIVTIRAFSQHSVVETVRCTGTPRQISDITVKNDAITGIELIGGAAALIDIVYQGVEEELWQLGDPDNPGPGWELLSPQPPQSGHEGLPGFSYPMTLPVLHHNYPATGRRDLDPTAAWALAAKRLSCSYPQRWRAQFLQRSPEREEVLHDQLVKLVSAAEPSPAGITGAPSQPLPGTPYDQDAAPTSSPSLKEFRQLPWLLLSALDPSVAQMLGLYFIDGTAGAGSAYDYLLLADHSNFFKCCSGQEALARVNSEKMDFTRVDGWVCWDVRHEGQTNLTAPTGAEVYALPGPIRPQQEIIAKSSDIPPGAKVALGEQKPGLLTAVCVGNDGALWATWAFGVTRWHEPIRISRPNVFPPGGVVALAKQTDNTLTALAVGKDRRLYVAWVVNDGIWVEPVPFGPALAPPGANIAMAKQTSDILTALVVGDDAKLHVAWVQGAGLWNAPVPIGQAVALPGSAVAMTKQTDDTLTAVFIGNTGQVYVAWVVGTSSWNGPVGFGPKIAPPGGNIALAKQTANMLTAIFVGHDRRLNVTHVVGAEPWASPAPTGGAIAQPGASVVLDRLNRGQLTAVIVGSDSKLYDAHVIGAGGTTEWKEPSPIGGALASLSATAGLALVKPGLESLLAMTVDGYGRHIATSINASVFGTSTWTKPAPFKEDPIPTSNSVGLRWILPRQESAQGTSGLSSGSPVMYYIWRADLGQPGPNPPTNAPSVGQFRPITSSPIIVTRPRGTLAPPTDWPPFPSYFIDRDLEEGWYAYRISSVDVFGRHSGLSEPAQWKKWSPAPKTAPWYWSLGHNDTAHTFAIGLLSKVAPPPPSRLEATILDPEDRTLVVDARYQAWRAAHAGLGSPKVVGLRVRFRWTEALARQAPDTHEFRIYWQSGRFNVLRGRVTAVNPGATRDESLVTTDFPATPEVNAFAGSTLQVGSDSFHIFGSTAGSPLQLSVGNVGPLRDIRPMERALCGIRLPGTEPRERQSWERRIAVVPVSGATAQGIEPIQDAGGQWLSGSPSSNTAASYSGSTALLPSTTNIAVVRPYVDWLHLYDEEHGGGGTYLIIGKNDAACTVTLDRAVAPGAGGPSWAIGIAYRQYDTLLPEPAAGAKDIMEEPDLANPVAFAQIGVSGADAREHVSDDPKFSGPTSISGPWSNRRGNEGQVGGPAEVFRIHRQSPPQPRIPPVDSDRVYATRADYHGHSYFAYRWIPQPNLLTHIYRASDEALFAVDWKQRLRATPLTVEAPVFPEGDPHWPPEKRQEVVDQLNHVDTFTGAQDEAFAYYRTLSNDALRILASLPEVVTAFVQLTIQPLDPNDIGTHDRRCRSDPDTYRPEVTSQTRESNLRLYEDRLAGRSNNRYFYRCAYVDRAHNSSCLSLASVPVYLPQVVPPKPPTVTKILSGDRQITVSWASNREPELAEYRIYKTESQAVSRDLRLMTLVHTELVRPGDPQARPVQLSWADARVRPLKDYYYRLVAVDCAQNVSAPSSVVVGRAYDYSPPAEPIWIRSKWVKLDASGNERAWSDLQAGLAPAIAFTFTTAQPNTAALVQRQVGGRWQTATAWLRDPEYDSVSDCWRYSAYDRRADSALQNVYRAKLMSSAGVVLESAITRAVPAQP